MSESWARREASRRLKRLMPARPERIPAAPCVRVVVGRFPLPPNHSLPPTLRPTGTGTFPILAAEIVRYHHPRPIFRVIRGGLVLVGPALGWTLFKLLGTRLAIAVIASAVIASGPVLRYLPSLILGNTPPATVVFHHPQRRRDGISPTEAVPILVGGDPGIGTTRVTRPGHGGCGCPAPDTVPPHPVPSQVTPSPTPTTTGTPTPAPTGSPADTPTGSPMATPSAMAS